MTDPFPCVFCGSRYLKLKAVVFRHWNMHCDGCGAHGPTGKTPDVAITAWNSYHNQSLTPRKDNPMANSDLKTTKKIWKTLRALRIFTVSEVALLTEIKRPTVRQYVYLLEKRGYLRIETQKKKPGAPNVYRFLKPKQVEPPSWTQLRYKDIDEAINNDTIRFMKPARIKARDGQRETADVNDNN